MTPGESALIIAEAARRGLVKAAVHRWCPHTPHTKQAEFLGLNCEEAFYGGSARGGKSESLLMGALQHIDTPGYAALILRRTYKDLSLPGAIMDRSHDWFRSSPAKWDDDSKTWTFPSGSTLTFGYLESERDKYRYQGAAFQYIAFDELTHFLESQYTYLFSRLTRLKGATIPLRMRGAGNPGGIGHEWVKRRFVTAAKPGVVFVPARLYDNPHEDHAAYERSIAHADELTRRQLLNGEWVRDVGGLIYPFVEKNIVEVLPARGDWQYVLSVDFGASQVHPSTSIGVTAYSFALPDEVYKVSTELSAGMTPSKIALRIKQLEDTYDFTSFIGDQGALGIGYINEFKQRWAIPMKPARKADKLGHRKLMRGDIERGAYKIVRSMNKELLAEAEAVTWNEDGDDCETGQACHCFVAGTMVQTADGERPIETILPGELVWTRAGLRPVKRSGHTGVRATFALLTDAGATLTGTANHPVWTGNGWVPLALLTPGCSLLLPRLSYAGMPVTLGDGEPAAWTTLSEPARDAAGRIAATSTTSQAAAPCRVQSVTATGRAEPVYNLTVERCPEFFANGILVHNCTDESLYGWREAKAYLAEAPAVLPEAGTPERLQLEEAAMIEAEVRAFVAQEERPWWKTR